LLREEVLGVIEVFSRREIRPPDANLVSTMDMLGGQIGHYIEWRRAEDERDRLWTLSLDMFCVAGFDGYFKLLNPAWERTLGFTQAELLARPYKELIHPKDRAATLAAAEQTTTGAHVTAFENRYRCKDGSYKWLLWNAVPLPEERKIYAVAHDITERKRMQELEVEMRGARRIQQKLFPVAAPELAGFDIGGTSSAVGAAGGDYFDYLRMPDQGVGIAIGDVSGHGFGPALLMASVRAYLRGLARSHADVGEILRFANRLLTDDVDGEDYVTLFLARLDPQTRSFVYANAGHPPGYLFDRSGAVKRCLESTGVPLGILPEWSYPPSDVMTLEPGDLVLLVTDGINEAAAPDGTMFCPPGRPERAFDVVRANRSRTAQEIVGALCAAVRDHCKGNPPLDDITVIVIKA
jgi:PAS domain S-box-containing protein